MAQNQDRQSVPAAGYSVKQHNGSFSLDKPLQMGMIDIYIKNVTKKLNIFFAVHLKTHIKIKDYGKAETRSGCVRITLIKSPKNDV